MINENDSALSINPAYYESKKLGLPEFKAGPATALLPSLEYGFRSSITQKLTASALDLFGSDTVLSPEQAKTSFNIDVNEPIKASTAAYMEERRKYEREYAEKMSAIDTSGALGFMSTTGAQFVGGLVDPLNIAFYSIGGWALGSAARALAPAAMTRATAFLGGSSLGASMFRGAVTEAIESGTLEALIEKNYANIMQEEFGFKEYMENVGVGFIGGGIFGGVGFAGRSALDKFRKTSKVEAEAADSISRDYTQNNKLPEYDNIKRIIYDNREPDAPTYTYTPVSPANLQGATLYGSFQNGKVPDASANNTYSRSYGQGIVFTDSLEFAQGSAGKNIDFSTGTLVEINLKDPKLYDLKDQLPPEIKDSLRQALEPYIDKDEMDVLDATTSKKVLDDVESIAFANNDSSVQEAVNQVFKDYGFDGYLFKNDDATNPSNSVFLFDSKQAEMGNVVEVEPLKKKFISDNRKRSVERIITDINDPKRDLLYDPEFEVLDTYEPILKDVEDIPEIQAEIKDIDEALDLIVEDINKYDEIKDIPLIEDLVARSIIQRNLKAEFKSVQKEILDLQKSAMTPEEHREASKLLFFCKNKGD